MTPPGQPCRLKRALLPRLRRTSSIKSKTFVSLAILLSCFAALGVNSYLTLRTTGEKLGALRARTLPRQTAVMSLSSDIIATHMKVFRYVTLASNGVTRKLLDPLYRQVLAELDAETHRLDALAQGRHGWRAEPGELQPIAAQWSVYKGGVRDLLEVGRSDAPMAAMMLGATDEDFQAIAAHLNAVSAQVNARTGSLVSDVLASVDANRAWLAFGGAAGMLIGVLVATAFTRSLVKPIVAITQAMQKVSAGEVDVEIGYQDRKDEVGQMVRAVSTFRRTTQCHVETVSYMARHDILTGLPNRLQFRERTEQALPLLKRGETFAVLCVDLDHFKEVNDTLGHPVGDQLLKMVADRLRQNVRETDIVARLGGDEFAVVQSRTERPEDMTQLARRVLEVLSDPYAIDGHEVVIGASIGVAIAPGDGDDPDQLLRNADMALYRAKADGRGTVRFFEAEMDVRIQARHKLETELRRALVQQEFEVYYQPIVDLASNRVAAFEALVRWNHPERGLIMPDVFVPVAEDIGLIGPIGEWVLQRACAQAAHWPAHIGVAVNLSPCQFRRTLVAAVLQALTASGLGAERLELEITESALLQNSETTLSMLQQLHEMGVGISLDDFGTGYSSLSYLHSFPIDKIKIDRSFVKQATVNPHCAAIVRALAGLGRTLDIKTTAEGVETEQQLEWLRAEGCSEVQGYLFSRPLAAVQLPALLCDVERRLGAGADVASLVAA